MMLRQARRQQIKQTLQTGIALIAVGSVLLPLFLESIEWPSAARDYLEQYGVSESGAINLVSAIYLGYRAFDTLGETIVLLTAVIGTIGILTRAGARLTHGYENSDTQLHSANQLSRHGAENAAPVSGEAGNAGNIGRESGKRYRPAVPRTHLLEAVTGTLGPIVLIFGVYVMLYGHLSPGGGFQGGVVIASGIVFLALGNRKESSTSLIRASVLNRIEAAAFLLLILLSLSGILFGSGFFSSPLSPHLQNSNPAAFIIMLNAVIGLKVGAGIGFMCIAMIGQEET